jgi:hypothetical protein
MQEEYMGRKVKQMHKKRRLLGTGDSLVDGGVAPRQRAPGLSRPGTGRLGRALAEAKKLKPGTPKEPNKPEKKKTSSANALTEWENEGGQTPPRSVRATSKAAVAKNSVKKKKGKPASSLPNPQPVSGPDRARQRQAKAAAKLSRIKRSGLKSRVLGHVSARGKRAQARRDAKNN